MAELKEASKSSEREAQHCRPLRLFNYTNAFCSTTNALPEAILSPPVFCPCFAIAVSCTCLQCPVFAQACLDAVVLCQVVSVVGGLLTLVHLFGAFFAHTCGVASLACSPSHPWD